MRCQAIIETARLDFDTVIIWDRDGTLIAFAYLEGRVMMTRPLEIGTSVSQAIIDTCINFQITDGQVSYVLDRATDMTIEPIVMPVARPVRPPRR